MQTSGATSGLHHLLTHVFPAGSTVFVERFSYMIALRWLRALRFTVVPVDVDDEGMSISALEQAIEQHLPQEYTDAHGCPFRAAVYIIPTFQNPTGMCTSDGACAA